MSLKKSSTKTSRKGKKAWVKNVDISEIEASLEELRTEERLGGQLHKRPNESLFMIERKGDVEVKQKLKHRRLRIDEILDPNSTIPALSQAGRPGTMKKIVTQNGKTRIVSKTFLSEVERLAKKSKEQAAKSATSAVAKPETRSLTGKKRKISDDLWGAPQPADDEEDKDSFLGRTKLIVKPVKKPKLPDERPAHIPAVTVPLPGASYNPSFDDHQNILQTALDIELKKIKAKDEFDKQMSYPPELDEIDDEDFFESDEEGEEEATPAADDNDEASSAPKKNAKRKTKAQKARAKAAAQQKLIDDERKKEKELLKQVEKIRQIESSLESENKKKEEISSRKAQSRAEKAMKPESRKIGPHTFKPAPVEIKLSEELTEGLLRLKPEGNVVKDRFLSLQERAIIETRVPVSKRQRYKRKETERHDYKRFDKETFASL